MFTHVHAVTIPDFLGSFAIRDLVSNVDHEPRNIIRLAARSFHDVDYVLKRAVKLFDKIVADDLLVLIPRDLAGDKKQSPACISKLTI